MRGCGGTRAGSSPAFGPYEETGYLAQEFLKLPNLIVVVGDGCDGADQSFCDRGRADGFREGDDSVLNLRGKAQHT